MEPFLLAESEETLLTEINSTLLIESEAEIPVPLGGNFLLLTSGDSLLIETGDSTLLEISEIISSDSGIGTDLPVLTLAPIGNSVVLTSGDLLLIEDRSFLLLESTAIVENDASAPGVDDASSIFAYIVSDDGYGSETYSIFNISTDEIGQFEELLESLSVSISDSDNGLGVGALSKLVNASNLTAAYNIVAHVHADLVVQYLVLQKVLDDLYAEYDVDGLYRNPSGIITRVGALV